MEFIKLALGTTAIFFMAFGMLTFIGISSIVETVLILKGLL